MQQRKLCEHVFLGLPAARPRVWVDLSTAASKRAGLGMNVPGRRVLRWTVSFLKLFAFLPIEKLLPGKRVCGQEIESVGILYRIYGDDLTYATIYTGNDSAKSKITALVKLRCKGEGLGDRRIVKLAKSMAATEAIDQEQWALEKLMHTTIWDRIPVLGKRGVTDGWTWCEQSVLPSGYKEMHFTSVYRRFLDELQYVTREGEKVMVHGDFAPWNCAVVGGRLYVYDWEDAHMGAADEDEKWFRGQVKKLLGITA